MLNQNDKQEKRAHETKTEKKIEEVEARVAKLLESLEQIEVEETWMKTWRTHKSQSNRT